MTKTDEYYIKAALREARKAYGKGEVPVGCVIVVADKIIARAHNQREARKTRSRTPNCSPSIRPAGNWAGRSLTTPRYM